MEETIDKIKWYQHTPDPIYGNPVRQRGYIEDSEDEIEPVRSIRAVVRSDKKITPLLTNQNSSSLWNHK